MIAFNAKDRFLAEIIQKANASLRNMSSDSVQLVAYGISKECDCDVLIDENFRGLSSSQLDTITRFLQSKGLRVSYGRRWELVREYDNNGIGLGYTIRKNTPAVAANIMKVFWMAMTNHLAETSMNDVDTTEPSLLEEQQMPGLRRQF